MKRLIAAVCAFLMIAVACGRSNLFDGADEPREAITIARRSVAPAEAEPVRQLAVDRKLVRIIDLELAVDDGEATAERLRDLATSQGGYVGSTDARRRQGALSYSMTLYVPADALEATIARIKEMASAVDREHLRSEDVTDQVVDLDARLRTLTATEVELRALLQESRTRGHGLEDIMAVYRELTRIRSEVERLQAQLENLEKRVSLSTINLILRPTATARPVVAGGWSAADLARNSTRSLVHVLQALAGFAIFFVIVVVPVALIVAVPAWGAAGLWRRSRLGGAAQPSATSE